MNCVAFPSESKARKRLSELRKQNKELERVWFEYISKKQTPRPVPPLVLPDCIRVVEVNARGKEGLIQAFETGILIGRAK